jgi:hypothetical protein
LERPRPRACNRCARCWNRLWRWQRS